MEDWKKSEGTFNLACDLERASGMMQNTCVKIEHVTKRFGEDMVLQEVNLSLKTGNVYGIVGNNGSGKTVLMKCICGFLPVTTGTIFVFGKKIGHDVDFPESLGVIIETPGFLTQYTGFKKSGDPGRHEWPDFEGRYPHSLKKGRIESGHEETSRKIFPWNASTPWYCTGHYGRSSVFDSG